MVEVPSAASMDDATFRKHINKRHVGRDFVMPIAAREVKLPHIMGLARAAHDQSHRRNPSQDHIHLEES